MNLIKKEDLLKIYEKNLSKNDKTEISVSLNYSSASSLKRALRSNNNPHLDFQRTLIAYEFFENRGGFAEQLAIANKKSEEYTFQTNETNDLLAIINSTIPRIQNLSDPDYLNKLKKNLEVVISTIENQFKISTLN